ncbi:hypothetical protein N657DRAFT_574960 [Parathielavia appendiculata]|uniref:DUF2293 domain-containing protein n=1 Tax=Parathielavia appendiculata TaxID=2587402 RepID=A0AAN6Z3F8_9PEZI|nr:hypothetical protein N657DRAFT_574960 [Parathielavia appendiculata]
MGREKRNVPGVGAGDHAKKRHKRDRRGNLIDHRGNVIDWTAPVPPGLVARPEKPRISSKHKSWFEFIENKDKKKKLEFEFTEKKEPPPGFEFVPIGNPALTTACKELSREQDAMIFIVTSAHGLSKRLSSQLNRVGHHIRQTIVEQARAMLGDDQLEPIRGAPGLPEPIPEKQEEINKQADAAIRDLFPRIPNTDRQMIIEHAFNKSRANGKDGPPVGLAPDVPLSRRVQLAVLAHIRHTHTRYDQLLRETTYVNARKAVESLCLDFLVKWRGDEETGRDQLDEILCEVIVISDSESDESDDDNEDDGEDDSSVASSTEESPVDRLMRDDGPTLATVPPNNSSTTASVTNKPRGERVPKANHAPQKVKKVSNKDKKAAKWAQRGFQRYQAARDQAWHQAVERQRLGDGGSVQSSGPATKGGSQPHGPQRLQNGEPSRPGPGLKEARSPAQPSYYAACSYDSSLSSVGTSHERGSRAENLKLPVPGATYHMPQSGRVLENTPNNGVRPVVRPRPGQFAPEVERVRHQGQEDLKDYLLQSIEPASPDLSNFQPRLPVSYRQPEFGLSHGVESLIQVTAHNRGATGAAGSMPFAHESRPAYADEGFIRLPSRPEPSRIPWTPGQRSEPFILLNPEPVTVPGVNAVTAAPGGLGLRRSSAWQDGVASHDNASLRSASRPVWVGHDGALLRSEVRPIIIQDYPSPPRQPRTDSPYVPSEHRRPSPRWLDARQVGPGWVQERHRPQPGSRIDQRIETLQDDFVEIVRVSNKFPRQHEPRPTATRAGSYNLRSTAPQQQVTQQPYDGLVRYNTGNPLAPSQPVERVVGRAEVPVFPDENGPDVGRPADGYPRQERVVGIEFVQPRPSLETLTYSDHRPFYDTRDLVFRSRSKSLLPVPYQGFQYQPETGHPKRSEVITLD